VPSAGSSVCARRTLALAIKRTAPTAADGQATRARSVHAKPPFYLGGEVEYLDSLDIDHYSIFDDRKFRLTSCEERAHPNQGRRQDLGFNANSMALGQLSF
jgi:hypothetical protein